MTTGADFFQVVSGTKDFVLMLAGCIGVFVAWQGLHTWQRQLKGASDYDLARRILIALFKFRDAINGVRFPAMWSNEMPAPSENAAKNMSEREIRHFGTVSAYQARWEKVRAERSNLYAELLESEAVWGPELTTLFKPVFSLEHELSTAVRNYLEVMDPNTRPETVDAIETIRRRKRDILYDDLSEEGDDYRKDFKTAVKAISDYVKPKFSRS